MTKVTSLNEPNSNSICVRQEEEEAEEEDEKILKIDSSSSGRQMNNSLTMNMNFPGTVTTMTKTMSSGTTVGLSEDDLLGDGVSELENEEEVEIFRIWDYQEEETEKTMKGTSSCIFPWGRLNKYKHNNHDRHNHKKYHVAREQQQQPSNGLFFRKWIKNTNDNNKYKYNNNNNNNDILHFPSHNIMHKNKNKHKFEYSNEVGISDRHCHGDNAGGVVVVDIPMVLQPFLGMQFIPTSAGKQQQQQQPIWKQEKKKRNLHPVEASIDYSSYYLPPCLADETTILPTHHHDKEQSQSQSQSLLPQVQNQQSQQSSSCATTMQMDVPFLVQKADATETTQTQTQTQSDSVCLHHLVSSIQEVVTIQNHHDDEECSELTGNEDLFACAQTTANIHHTILWDNDDHDNHRGNFTNNSTVIGSKTRTSSLINHIVSIHDECQEKVTTTAEEQLSATTKEISPTNVLPMQTPLQNLSSSKNNKQHLEPFPRKEERNNNKTTVLRQQQQDSDLQQTLQQIPKEETQQLHNNDLERAIVLGRMHPSTERHTMKEPATPQLTNKGKSLSQALRHSASTQWDLQHQEALIVSSAEDLVAAASVVSPSTSAPASVCSHSSSSPVEEGDASSMDKVHTGSSCLSLTHSSPTSSVPVVTLSNTFLYLDKSTQQPFSQECDDDDETYIANHAGIVVGPPSSGNETNSTTTIFNNNNDNVATRITSKTEVVHDDDHFFPPPPPCGTTTTTCTASNANKPASTVPFQSTNKTNTTEAAAATTTTTIVQTSTLSAAAAAVAADATTNSTVSTTTRGTKPRQEKQERHRRRSSRTCPKSSHKSQKKHFLCLYPDEGKKTRSTTTTTTSLVLENPYTMMTHSSIVYPSMSVLVNSTLP